MWTCTMEAKERNVEAWMIDLPIDVNDYLPSDDLPIFLFCFFFFFFVASSCCARLQQISREGFVKHCHIAI